MCSLYRVLPGPPRTWCGESPRLACGVSAPADPLRPLTLPARLPSSSPVASAGPGGPRGPCLVEALHGSSCLFRWDSSLILGKLQAVLAKQFGYSFVKCSLVESVEMSSSAVRAEPAERRGPALTLTPVSRPHPRHPPPLALGIVCPGRSLQWTASCFLQLALLI